MLAYILIGAAALVAVLVMVIARRPNEFRVSRSATMAAPAADVFAQVNDHHKWEAWSPWMLDPAMKQKFEGPPLGVGSIYSWDGNKNVGAGRSTIVESRPNELVRFKLEFFRPFKGVNDVEFTFKPVGDQTNVSWNMAGKNTFLTKAVGLMIDCEKMCADQFDKGLANLKRIVETSRTEAPAGVGG